MASYALTAVHALQESTSKEARAISIWYNLMNPTTGDAGKGKTIIACSAQEDAVI
ncbi:MAG: hypothetical protein WBZ42_00905 [Halobacteriota archaeon]